MSALSARPNPSEFLPNEFLLANFLHSESPPAPPRIPRVLAIAGSDPSGGAGIQADLKSIAANGGYGMAAITALTAQNTQGVRSFQTVAADFVAAQIDAVFDDVRVDAVKIGMVATAEIATVVADRLRHHAARNVVLPDSV